MQLLRTGHGRIRCVRGCGYRLVRRVGVGCPPGRVGLRWEAKQVNSRFTLLHDDCANVFAGRHGNARVGG